MKKPLEWTAPQLAKMFGVSRAAVSRWIDIGLVPFNGSHGKARRLDIRAALSVGLLAAWNRQGHSMNQFAAVAQFFKHTDEDELMGEIGRGNTILVGPDDGKNPCRLVPPSVGPISVCISNDRPGGVSVNLIAIDLAVCLSRLLDRVDTDVAKYILREIEKEEAAANV